MEDLSNAVKLVGEALNVAQHVPCGNLDGSQGETDLSAEVIASAMLYLTEHKGATIEDSLTHGLDEWLK